jgi:glutamine amidotransferase
MQELQASFADRVHPPSWSELAPEVARIAEHIASHGNCNFLLSNGQALYAHCSSKLYTLQRSHPFTTAKLVDCDMRVDLGALNAPTDRIIVIATEPLTDEERWVPMRSGELQVFVEGTTVWQQVNERTRAFAPMTTHCGRGSLVATPGATA